MRETEREIWSWRKEKGKRKEGKEKRPELYLKNKIKTWLKRNMYYGLLGAENVLSVKMQNWIPKSPLCSSFII